MRVLIDTNVLISAALHPNSVPSQAYIKAVTKPFRASVCDQNVDEMRRVFNDKFPTKILVMERFLAEALLVLDLIQTPTDIHESEQRIRDVKDRPILRAAITAGVDILISGDKDFLESGIVNPRIMTSAEFLGFQIQE